MPHATGGQTPTYTNTNAGSMPVAITHDLIVVGASAGGVEALMQLARDLPADLPAAVCVVLHIPPDAASALPQILTRVGQLPALHPQDGAALEPGRIYIAPPDLHLLVARGRLHTVHGPRENRSRPAVDPLFRSAARAYGPRVVGVVLTGALDDGTAGLLAIKRAGGVAIVQDPDDALFPSMPSSALRYVPVDYNLPLASIAPTLARLAHEPIVESGGAAMARQPDFDTQMEDLARAALEDDERPGEPSPFGCPECGGVLWEREQGALARYRCRVGHAYSVETLLAAQADAYEAALWSALRALEEKAQLTRRLVERAEAHEMSSAATRFRAQMAEADGHVEALRRLLLSGVPQQVDIRPRSTVAAQAGQSDQ
jgi:two-component system chemotaxis response regulator CheB